jgi:guanylate kinase
LAEGDRFDVRIVNDDLDRCVEEVLAVIEDARLQPPHHPWDT